MSKSKYVTGVRAVEQLLATPGTEVRRIYAEYQTANPRVTALIAEANKRGIEVQPANRARLQQISEERLQEGGDRKLLLLLLDGVQDPHNLGACMRTADAVGVDAIIVPRHGAAGLGPTVSKVAAGAAEHIAFAPVANLGRVMGWLAEYGVTIIGTSDKANASLYDTDLNRPLALIMGREHEGLSKRTESLCEVLVSLPMQGVVSSLNVSVATGICLYEAARQRL
jgi:23S rRNA (guanosine2251-2'-O)-methyltransferase